MSWSRTVKCKYSRIMITSSTPSRFLSPLLARSSIHDYIKLPCTWGAVSTCVPWPAGLVAPAPQQLCPWNRTRNFEKSKRWTGEVDAVKWFLKARGFTSSLVGQTSRGIERARARATRVQCRGLQTGEVSWESPFFETGKGTGKHRCHEIDTHIFCRRCHTWASGVVIPRGMQRIALAMLGSTIYGFKKYLKLGCWIMSVAQALLDFPTWERAPCSTHCVTLVRQWCNIATCFDMLLHLFQSLLPRLFAPVYHLYILIWSNSLWLEVNFFVLDPFHGFLQHSQLWQIQTGSDASCAVTNSRNSYCNFHGRKTQWYAVSWSIYYL